MEIELQKIFEIKKDINVKKNLEYLINKHEGVFHKIVNSFLFMDVHGLTKQDVADQKLTIFWQAAIDFDSERGVKFVTWLGKSTFFFVSKEYNKVKEFKNSLELLESPSFLEPHQIILSSDKEVKREERLELLDLVLEEIKDIEDERIIKIFELRYFKTHNHKLTTWKEIGKNLNLTGQSCLNLHNKGIKYLQHKIKNGPQNFIQHSY